MLYANLVTAVRLTSHFKNFEKENALIQEKADVSSSTSAKALTSNPPKSFCNFFNDAEAQTDFKPLSFKSSIANQTKCPETLKKRVSFQREA